MHSWRFFQGPVSGVFFQMDWDQKLFEEFLKDPKALPMLRVYGIREPAMTIGNSYRSRIPFWLRFRRMPLCVRPTGGGLVYHGRDLIYSVIARRDTFPTFQRVRTSYLSFHEVVQEAFSKLGVETRLVRCDEVKSNRRPPLTDCFAHAVATDLLLNGKKIAGGAQRHRAAAFLHQGSVQLPKGISFETFKVSFLAVFREKFQIEWETKI